MSRNEGNGVPPGEAGRIDAWVREGLAAGGETVERVVRASLRSGPGRTGRTRRALALGAAAAIVLAALLLLLPPRDGRDGGGAEPRRTVELLTITNESGTVEVIYPEPEITLLNSNGVVAAVLPAAATHYLVYRGEP